jgi:hypothetical protein
MQRGSILENKLYKSKRAETHGEVVDGCTIAFCCSHKEGFARAKGKYRRLEYPSPFPHWLNIEGKKAWSRPHGMGSLDTPPAADFFTHPK